MEFYLSLDTAVNLLPWRDVRYQKKRRIFFLLLTFCLVCTLASWVIMQWQQRQVIARQAKHIYALQQQWRGLNQTIQRKQEQQAQYGFLNAALSRHHSMLAMLALLAQKIPENVYLSQVDSDGATMTLWGNALTHADIALFLQRVDQLTRQKQARLSETNHLNTQNSALTFQITYDLKEFTAH